MATSPTPFTRFLADNIILILAISERDGVDDADLLMLCERHLSAAQPSAEHIRRQLMELGFIERAAYAENAYDLWQPVKDMLNALTKRHRLASAIELRGYFDELQRIEQELARAVQDNDVSSLLLALPDAQRVIARIRDLSAGNRETIVTEAQKIRSSTEGLSPLQRMQTIRRLWERYIDPLRQLVEPTGELESRLDTLHTTLHLAEQRFLTNRLAHTTIGRTIPALARMRRDVRADHQTAVREMSPLYDRIQRDSTWYRGAAKALAMIRDGEIQKLDLDARLGITGWRPRYLMADNQLRPRIIALTKFRPSETVYLTEPNIAAANPIVSREELEHAIAATPDIEDVLEFILARWPDHPLRAQLAAYGQAISGKVGHPEVDTDAHEVRHHTHGVVLRATPVALRKVTP